MVLYIYTEYLIHISFLVLCAIVIFFIPISLDYDLNLINGMDERIMVENSTQPGCDIGDYLRFDWVSKSRLLVCENSAFRTDNVFCCGKRRRLAVTWVFAVVAVHFIILVYCPAMSRLTFGVDNNLRSSKRRLSRLFSCSEVRINVGVITGDHTLPDSIFSSVGTRLFEWEIY